MTSEWIPGIQVNGACEAEGIGGGEGGGGGGWMVVQHSSNPAMCSAWEGRWPHGLCAWHQCLSFCATDASSIMPLLHLNGFLQFVQLTCCTSYMQGRWSPMCLCALPPRQSSLFCPTCTIEELHNGTSAQVHGCIIAILCKLLPDVLSIIEFVTHNI